MKIACFTVAALDYYPQLKSYFAGGNALNQSIRYARMEKNVSFVGALGTDEAGDRIEELFKSSGVDTSHLYRLDGITACNQLINDDHGERFGVENAWKDGVYGEFKLNDNDWLFLKSHQIWTTHANNPDFQSTLQNKTTAQFLAVDFLHLTDYKLLINSLPYLDIAYFGGTIEMKEQLLDISGKNDKIIVLTLGAKGSIAFHNGEVYQQEALEIENVVDTTGCGDAFQAGFTLEYYQTRDIKKALLKGAQMGKTAASHYGGVSWE